MARALANLHDTDSPVTTAPTVVGVLRGTPAKVDPSKNGEGAGWRIKGGLRWWSLNR